MDIFFFLVILLMPTGYFSCFLQTLVIRNKKLITILCGISEVNLRCVNHSLSDAALRFLERMAEELGLPIKKVEVMNESLNI